MTDTNNIPLRPSAAYEEDWISSADFLGHGCIKGKEFLPFDKARDFARTLKLTNQKQWHEYCVSGKKPNDIPSTPSTSYKEWVSWADWLGTIYIGTGKREFLPFKEARSFVRSLKLQKSDQWKAYCKSDKPSNIPSHPHVIYKDEWQGWGDWFGTGTVATYKRKYKSFKKAKEFVRSKKFKNQQAWFDYCGSGKRPDDVPANPHKVYKKEWKGMGDWLGVANKCLRGQQRPFEKARKFARKLNFKNQKEWFDYCKSGKKPADIPTAVHVAYKKDWKGIRDWLGY